MHLNSLKPQQPQRKYTRIDIDRPIRHDSVGYLIHVDLKVFAVWDKL